MIRAWAPVFALAILALPFVGWGPVNGDAAVYAHQAGIVDVWQRPSHAGYIAVLALFYKLVGASSWVVADSLTLLACMAAVYTLGLNAKHPIFTRWFGAALLLPYAAHGEVDMVWMALVLGWLYCDHRAAAGVMLGAAISVSPLALLAIPFGSYKHRRVPVLVISVTLCLLIGFSQGEWLLGDRGLLQGAGTSSLRIDWLVRRLPVWCLVAATWRKEHLLLLPLLVAPSDQPSAVLAVLIALRSIEAPKRRVSLVALALGFGVLGLSERAQQVRKEQRLVAELARGVVGQAGLVAPWSLGVRASIATTGDPYALMWRPPNGFVRDQAARWCAGEQSYVLRVEPSAEMGPWGPNRYEVRREAAWMTGCDADVR